MMQTVERIVAEAQQLSPEEQKRLIAALMGLLESNSGDRPATSYAQLYRQASQLVGRFKDIEDATDLAANHDRYLDESYQ
jgi:hypothetical protein